MHAVRSRNPRARAGQPDQIVQPRWARPWTCTPAERRFSSGELIRTGNSLAIRVALRQAEGGLTDPMEAFQQLWAVVVVLGVLCGGLWLLKRKGWARTALRRGAEDGLPRLEIVDRLPLTPQHSLHLVRLADRTLLIGLVPEWLQSAGVYAERRCLTGPAGTLDNLAKSQCYENSLPEPSSDPSPSLRARPIPRLPI